MIRLYLVAWSRNGAQVVNPVIDGIDAIGQPASCAVVAAPAQQDGAPNKGHFVVLVEAADTYPWATLASVSGAKLLPEINYTAPLTKQQEGAIQRQLDGYGLVLPTGMAAADAFESVAKQIHPESKIADRLRGIIRPLAPSGTFTDDFTEATTDTALESHAPSGGTAWTRVDGAAGAAEVQAATDTLRVRSATTTAYTCDDQGTADHYTQARLKRFGNGSTNSFVCARLVDKDNFLGWRVFGTGATGLRLCKVVSATITDLVSFQTVDEAIYRVEVSGSDAEIFEDGVSKGTATYSENTTETSQGVRIGDVATFEWIDDFEAGALGGASLNVSATTDTLIITEQAATIGLSKNVSAGLDALVITEYAATIGSAQNVQATTDALVIAEQAATVSLAINVQVGTDALVITEYPVSFSSSLDVQASTQALVLTERQATLSFSKNVTNNVFPLVIQPRKATVGAGETAVQRGSFSREESDFKTRQRLRKLALQQAYLEDDEEALAILLATLMRKY